jgi:hypothetical protein
MFKIYRLSVFDLSFYFSRKCFIKEQFLSDSRWCLVQDGGQNSKEHNFRFFRQFVICFSQCVCIFFINMNRSKFRRFSQKLWFDPKWRIKISRLNKTLVVPNVFPIFFLHSFGVSETQILWENVFKKHPRWWLKLKKICRYFGFFGKLFHTK